MSNGSETEVDAVVLWRVSHGARKSIGLPVKDDLRLLRSLLLLHQRRSAGTHVLADPSFRVLFKGLVSLRRQRRRFAPGAALRSFLLLAFLTMRPTSLFARCHFYSLSR